MVKNGYKKNLQDLCCLADFCIFIQRNELESTGISFPKLFTISNERTS